jgi:hydroxyacyl-ACP dehydratase HTD2-like protein with hotdog domain
LSRVHESNPNKYLPPAHHLVYFNPAYPEDKLLSDGTDPNQSPGYPFVRRMWAGGYVRFNPKSGIRVDKSRYACVEGIRDVTIKGKPGQEKVFVGIERRFAPVLQGETDNTIISRLWEEKEDDFGESRLIERRNIVFMYERTSEELQAMRRQGATTKILKRMSPMAGPNHRNACVDC